MAEEKDKPEKQLLYYKWSYQRARGPSDANPRENGADQKKGQGEITK